MGSSSISSNCITININTPMKMMKKKGSTRRVMTRTIDTKEMRRRSYKTIMNNKATRIMTRRKKKKEKKTMRNLNSEAINKSSSS